MTVEIRPATRDRFDDVETMLGPKRSPDAIACWCLTYRLGNASAAKLDAPARRKAVRELCGQEPPPGVLAYRDGEVIGWASVAPRSQIEELADTEVYPHLGESEPWSIFCLRARGGNRRQGIGQHILRGAIDFAWDNGAEVIEAYPLDTAEKMPPIFTYPGLRSMFEREGFEKVGDTASEIGGARRIVMRLNGTT